MYSVASTASFFLQKRKFNRQRSPNSRNKSVVVDPKGREFRFNVSGDIFIIHESYLNQYPKTLLGSKGREKYFDHKENEYFWIEILIYSDLFTNFIKLARYIAPKQTVTRQ